MLAIKSGYGQRFWRARAGVAVLELAIVAPILALLLLGVAEIGFSMYQAMQVNYAAEAGLAYAVKNGWDATGIANAAVKSTGLSGMSATATQTCACPSAAGLAPATCGTVCTGGDKASQYINVSVSLTRVSIVGATGFGLPATLSAQAILRQD